MEWDGNSIGHEWDCVYVFVVRVYYNDRCLLGLFPYTIDDCKRQGRRPI